MFRYDDSGKLVYTVSPDMELRKVLHGAVAAWYDIVEIEPGTYPVSFKNVHYQVVDTLAQAYYVTVTVSIPARLVERYAPSLLCGVPVGRKGVEKVDEPTTDVCYTFSPYASTIRKRLQEQ